MQSEQMLIFSCENDDLFGDPDYSFILFIFLQKDCKNFLTLSKMTASNGQYLFPAAYPILKVGSSRDVRNTLTFAVTKICKNLLDKRDYTN